MEYKRPVRKTLTKEDLLRKEFVREIMVGDCPSCGSPNTHDCSREEFVPGAPIRSIDGSIRPMSIIRVGSDCEVAKKLDDPTIGHCDDCGYLWCLECGSELTVDDPVCEHWTVCGVCREERGYLALDEIVEKVCKKCEHWNDGCQIRENIMECEKIKLTQCPYEGRVSECPQILHHEGLRDHLKFQLKKWKAELREIEEDVEESKRKGLTELAQRQGRLAQTLRDLIEELENQMARDRESKRASGK